jgi:hypothetical protein
MRWFHVSEDRQTGRYYVRAETQELDQMADVVGIRFERTAGYIGREIFTEDQMLSCSTLGRDGPPPPLLSWFDAALANPPALRAGP